MPNSKPADRPLYAELIRRGLPTDYAARTAEELDDHRADLLAELRATGAADPEAVADERLGQPRKLAYRIAADYRRRSWFGRWPLLTSLLLAPATMLVVWTALFFALAIAIEGGKWLLGGPVVAETETWRDVNAARLMHFGCTAVCSYAAPVVLAMAFVGIALRRAQSRGYALVACVVLGILNGMIWHHILVNPENPALARNGFAIFVGQLSAGDLPITTLLPTQISQLLAPVAAGAVMLFRDHRRRNAALLAPSDGLEQRLVA